MKLKLDYSYNNIDAKYIIELVKMFEKGLIDLDPEMKLNLFQITLY